MYSLSQIPGKLLGAITMEDHGKGDTYDTKNEKLVFKARQYSNPTFITLVSSI